MSRVRAAFRDQARSCAALGSPFMARLMDLAAERLRPGTTVSDRLLGWTGDVTSSGQSVPLRFAGALHALKRAGDPGLSSVYPPAEAEDLALWSAVEEAMSRRAADLLDWLDLPPQTNEVRRSVALIPAMHLLAARFGLPIRLSELGCSAGLNLRADRFRLMAGDATYGPTSSAVSLAPDWQGPAPEPAGVQVVSRTGIDLAPIDPETDADRLFAYLWPDQPERLDLTAAAILIARECPAEIARGDAAAWLERRLAEPVDGTLHLVYHTVAWQYFPAETQARCSAALETAGRRATASAPLARFGMEADGGRGAALTLQVWPRGDTLSLGRADFHGSWIAWSTPCLDI